MVKLLVRLIVTKIAEEVNILLPNDHILKLLPNYQIIITLYDSYTEY